MILKKLGKTPLAFLTEFVMLSAPKPPFFCWRLEKSLNNKGRVNSIYWQIHRLVEGRRDLWTSCRPASLLCLTTYINTAQFPSGGCSLNTKRLSHIPTVKWRDLQWKANKQTKNKQTTTTNHAQFLGVLHLGCSPLSTCRCSSKRKAFCNKLHCAGQCADLQLSPVVKLPPWLVQFHRGVAFFMTINYHLAANMPDYTYTEHW